MDWVVYRGHELSQVRRRYSQDIMQARAHCYLFMGLPSLLAIKTPSKVKRVLTEYMQFITNIQQPHYIHRLHALKQSLQGESSTILQPWGSCGCDWQTQQAWTGAIKLIVLIYMDGIGLVS